MGIASHIYPLTHNLLNATAAHAIICAILLGSTYWIVKRNAIKNPDTLAMLGIVMAIFLNPRLKSYDFIFLGITVAFYWFIRFPKYTNWILLAVIFFLSFTGLKNDFLFTAGILILNGYLLKYVHKNPIQAYNPVAIAVYETPSRPAA